MTVVDSDNKWVLEGTDATNYLQTNTALLSLLINTSQGDEPVDGAAGGGGAPAASEVTKQRQAVLDAEWQQFQSGTLSGVTALVKGWPIDSAVLAVHAKHAAPSTFAFPYWESHNSPDLGTMVAAIYATSPGGAPDICTDIYAKYAPSK
jgi:hypothetical protein